MDQAALPAYAQLPWSLYLFTNQTIQTMAIWRFEDNQIPS